jgi:hypothetical protein
MRIPFCKSKENHEIKKGTRQNVDSHLATLFNREANAAVDI